MLSRQHLLMLLFILGSTAAPVSNPGSSTPRDLNIPPLPSTTEDDIDDPGVTIDLSLPVLPIKKRDDYVVDIELPFRERDPQVDVGIEAGIPLDLDVRSSRGSSQRTKRNVDRDQATSSEDVGDVMVEAADICIIGSLCV